MKKLIISLFLAITLLVNSSATYSQCCPYINSISIAPVNPTGFDEIQIFIEVSTPNLGSKISKNYYVSNGTIFLEACYYSGYLTQPQAYADTFDVGILDPGFYTIHLTAYQSYVPNYCDSGEHQIETSLIEVKQMTSVTGSSDQPAIEWFLNPVENSLSIKGIDMRRVTVFNLNGQIVFSEGLAYLSHIKIELDHLASGIYFIEIMDIEKNVYRGKILKN